jgi:hypothetical protein
MSPRGVDDPCPGSVAGRGASADQASDQDLHDNRRELNATHPTFAPVALIPFVLLARKTL